MTRFLLTLITGLFISCALVAGPDAGEDKMGMSLFDRWMSDAETRIELHVNFDSLEVYRRKTASLPARVVQDGQTLDLEVTVRGRFRRRTCSMPPLKLQFKKSGLRALGLNTHNDFKLVTHCTDDAAGQEALVREQLAYELYRTVHPAASLRTQLLTVTYVNTADGSTTTSYAILIEDIDELKNRLNAKNCDDCYALPAAAVSNAESLVLFQYMIGNSDFSTRAIRNTKLVDLPTGSKVFIPYDFDYSGLVNADYATGVSHLNETRVTDRTLLWEFETTPDFGAAAQHLTDLKDTLLAQVADHPYLSAGGKREVSKYLKGFYRELRAGTLTTLAK